MSDNLDLFSNPLNTQIIKEIDNLDLPIMQKHHLRILAHCLHILKIINDRNTSKLSNKNYLREWCDNQSRKFGDKKFSDLFYSQLDSTARKLNTFSQRIGKDIEDIQIEDLVILVKQNSELS